MNDIRERIRGMMTTRTSKEDFENVADFACTTSAEFDNLLTHLAASAIFYTMEGCQEESGKSGREANILLHFMEVKKPTQAKQMRNYLCHFGPFTIKRKPSKIFREGKPELVVKEGVKFSEEALKRFEGKTPEDVEQAAKACNFATWRKLAKEEAKSEADSNKTEEQLHKEAVDKMKKRVEKLRESIKEEGLTETEVGMAKEIKVEQAQRPAPPDAKSLLAYAKAIIAREDASAEDKEFCEALINFAATHYAMKERQKKAA